MNQNNQISTEQMLQVILQELQYLRQENAELKAMISTMMETKQISNDEDSLSRAFH